MTINKTQLGLEVFLGALVFGIAGEYLLFQAGMGLGAVLWMAGISFAGFILINRWEAAPSGFDRWILAPIILLACSYGWRDAGMLKFASTVGLVSLVGLSMQARQMSIIQLSKVEAAAAKIPGIISTGIISLIGYPIFIKREVKWDMLSTGIDKETVKSVCRGLLLVLPCLFVFGLLLSSADEGFGKLMGSFFDIDLISLPSRILITGFFTLIAGAYLRGVSTQVVHTRIAGKEGKKGIRLFMLEVGIVLGFVNLMFATFVFMQLGYLFGGAAYIDAASGVTLAQYTRKGFFELVVVASLALAVIMCLKRYFKPANTAHETLFRILAGVQIALLLVMLVSAAQRMWLYTASFGLTELRLYTSAFMAWLAFVLGWFTWTALKGKALQFARGSVLAGTFVVLGLHVINPEALIVRTNMNRAIEGETLDHHYLSTLSSDAVPVMLELLPDLSRSDQDKVVGMVVGKWKAQPAKDWRSWNLSHQVAAAKVQQTLDNEMFLQYRAALQPWFGIVP